MKKEWFILIILGILGLIFFFRKPLGGFIMQLFDDLYKKWADLRGLDWKLLKAIAMTESNENPNAIGDDGRSLGLMQTQLLIGKAYANVSNIEELYIPDKNVEAGSGFLADLLSKYSLNGAIQAYNIGETKFNKGISSPDYLAKVLKNYHSITEVA
jgi:soluble lytic murein transglycosylase-like protein